MTVSQAPFFHWNSRSDAGRPPYNTCSPALSSLYVYLNHNHGAQTLGCFASRPVRGGETASTHSWGAAIDVAFPSNGTTDAVEAWLIAYSQELGINAIIDERNPRALPGGNHEFRIWYPLVGWHTFVANASGYNGIHIEITPLAWGDGRPVEVKINAQPLPQPPQPGPSPAEETDVALWARFEGEAAEIAFDATGWRVITTQQRDQLRFARLLRDGAATGYPTILPQSWKTSYPQLP